MESTISYRQPHASAQIQTAHPVIKNKSTPSSTFYQLVAVTADQVVLITQPRNPIGTQGAFSRAACHEPKWRDQCRNPHF